MKPRRKKNTEIHKINIISDNGAKIPLGCLAAAWLTLFTALSIGIITPNGISASGQQTAAGSPSKPKPKTAAKQQVLLKDSSVAGIMMGEGQQRRPLLTGESLTVPCRSRNSHQRACHAAMPDSGGRRPLVWRRPGPVTRYSCAGDEPIA